MEKEREPQGPFAWPWATLALASAAGGIFWASAERALIYDRALIVQGQLWRAWTGHLVHFTPSHLGWNLAVLIPAGCWLERLWPRTARWCYVVVPLIISGALLAFDPALVRYAGLSGMASGVIVLLAGRQLARRERTESAWFWIGVLVLVVAKIGYEILAGAPLLAQGFEGVRNVPLAHLAGAVGGGLFWGFGLRKAAPADSPTIVGGSSSR